MNQNLLISPKVFFQELVREGLAQRKVETYPMVESYLVDLLEHYMDARNLFSEEDSSGRRSQKTLAELYLTATNSELSVKIDLLKKLGDTSLYVSGFFGDSLNRKIVDIDYYADMGGAAYGSLAQCIKEDTFAKVYNEFSQRFLEFVEVLSFISEQSFIKGDESVLRLYERYMRTGSEVARDKLISMGVITLPQLAIKKAKQN